MHTHIPIQKKSNIKKPGAPGLKSAYKLAPAQYKCPLLIEASTKFSKKHAVKRLKYAL